MLVDQKVNFQLRNVRFGSYPRRPDVMHAVVLHPLVQDGNIHPERVKIAENLVGYARNETIAYTRLCINNLK